MMSPSRLQHARLELGKLVLMNGAGQGSGNHIAGVHRIDDAVDP